MLFISFRVLCRPACRARTVRMPQYCFARVVACRFWVSRVSLARVFTRRSRVSRALPRAVRAYRALSSCEIKSLVYNHLFQLISYLINHPQLK
jgi:hypothetical protein